ncbi:hypothetical protein AND_006833 [Anopheles darlingi]|uniref:Ig-like domain-containing protein n=1 Tax=Anopheles darlingi TaxID=43151 RepID=W5JF40_ANODA|nr:hypothetical protein AND_006833 [Anopheles darlingi]
MYDVSVPEVASDGAELNSVSARTPTHRRPEPTVTWLNGNEIMQTGGGVSMGRHVTVNRLEISKMTRSALNNTYKCQASNTKLVPPAERSIRVDMLLKPLTTALSTKPKQLVSDQEYVIACNVEGSVPETDIKWMQNNRPFTKGKIKIINNSSLVSSVLSFRPHPDDDGTILKCEGSNPRLQNSVLEDSVIMNILSPPPPPPAATGQPVTQNLTSGIIISTRSLVLQRVGRFHSGSYACAAANDRGETQSDPVALKIHSSFKRLLSEQLKFVCDHFIPVNVVLCLATMCITGSIAPVCISNSIMIVGASLDETVPVPCHVAADPLDVSFDWNFSNSGERFEVASGQFNLLQDFHSEGITQSRYDADDDNSETIYELLYTPKSEREYGTLACWAKNSIGKQIEPCLFQVVPAAKPAPLRNCTLRPYSTLHPTVPHHGSSTSSSQHAAPLPNTSAASAAAASSSSYRSHGYGAGGDPMAGSMSTRAGSKSRQRNRNLPLSPRDDDGLARLTADAVEDSPSAEVPRRERRDPLVPQQHQQQQHQYQQQWQQHRGSATPGDRSDRADLLNTATAVLLGESISNGVLASSASADDPAGQRRPDANRLRRHTGTGSIVASAALNATRTNQQPLQQQQQQQHSGGNNYHSHQLPAAAHRTSALQPSASAAQLRSKAIRSAPPPPPQSGTPQSAPSSPVEPPVVRASSTSAFGGSSGGHSASYSGNHHHQQQQQQHHHFIDQSPMGGGNGGNGGATSGAASAADSMPTMMELECVAGYDGGLPQHFFLEAYDSRTRKLRLNITSALNDVPLFRIDLTELIPSESYTPTLHLIAYSVNQKGRSEPTILEDIAINEAEKRAAEEHSLNIHFNLHYLPTFRPTKNQPAPAPVGCEKLSLTFPNDVNKFSDDVPITQIHARVVETRMTTTLGSSADDHADHHHHHESRLAQPQQRDDWPDEEGVVGSVVITVSGNNAAVRNRPEKQQGKKKTREEKVESFALEQLQEETQAPPWEIAEVAVNHQGSNEAAIVEKEASVRRGPAKSDIPLDAIQQGQGRAAFREDSVRTFPRSRRFRANLQTKKQLRNSANGRPASVRETKNGGAIREGHERNPRSTMHTKRGRKVLKVLG